jgi:two-component sensor histidine kinase
LVNEIAVAPFADKQDRFQLQGPALRIPARLTLPFALSLHELCTNAAKYGALTNDRGRVLVEWGYAAADAMPRKFFMRWSESDGPPVTQPAAQGFGSRMIKNAFAADLGADATIDYNPTGLVCEIVLPLELAQSAPLQPQLS